MNRSRAFLSRRLAAALLLTAGGLLAGAAAAQPAAPVRIAYVDWSSSVASANLICAVIERRLNRNCELIQGTADEMWQRVADGDADAMLSAWLPTTHAHYREKYGERMDDLGPNLEGTRTGLVVPDIRVGRQTGASGARTLQTDPIQSIPDLREHRRQLGGRIMGIDPEAGIMTATERAISVYGLAGFRLVAGSEHEMTEALARAIARNERIVVTGWEPHWMFGRWALRFLDDPDDVYGGRGSIHTMVRRGLADDAPEVYRLLDRFHWDPDAMSQLLVWNQQGDGSDPYAQAERWMRAHPGAVDEWVGE
jgi:glycine betaine/proline transport system substrate-binding protein